MEKYFIKAAKSPVSRLEKLAPTDASFAEATAISFDVFPVSEEERRSITEMEECIAQAYKDKKDAECEEMQKKVMPVRPMRGTLISRYGSRRSSAAEMLPPERSLCLNSSQW